MTYSTPSRLAVLWLCALATLIPTARADRRSYVWSYEYMTMPKGHAEIEYYLTHKVRDQNKYADRNSWEHQAEFEYGLSDRWDIAIYQRWKQSNSRTDDDFDYTGTKLRTRYRFAEKGVWPLDTLLYLEYIRGDGSDAPDFLEGKIVVAKDFGRWNFAYNQIFKEGLNNKGHYENEYATGLSYEISPVWKVALEAKGNLDEHTHGIGPTITWGSEKMWIGFGVLAGLNDRSDDLQFRLIAGFPLP